MVLTDEQVEEIAQKVVDAIPSGDGSAPAEDTGEGEIILSSFDRETMIASRLVLGFVRESKVFDTKEELDAYLKEHPDADKSHHSVKPQSGRKVKQIDPKGRKPIPKKRVPIQDRSKKIEKKTKPSAKGEVSLGDKGADPDVNSHAIHRSQLTPGVLIRFPDGTAKKYGDLAPKEKEQVKAAIAEGKATSKGMNDYTTRSLEAVQGNMARNLARYDNPDVEETKNADTDPVSSDNVDEFAATLKKNASSVLKKYASSMSTVSRPMADQYVENVTSAVAESVKDGSLGNVPQDKLDGFVREEVKRLIHMEVESRRRSLGDHGIRHVATNADNTNSMLNELQSSGVKVTGKDKLIALSIQTNHDTGYTAGDIATDIRASGQHKEQSETLMREEMGRFSGIFGKKDANKMAKIVGTHDSNDMDWQKDPVGSAVRLSDSTALFGKEKVQDLFIRSPTAMNLACKLRLAAEAEPDNTDLQETIKLQMHDAIDTGGFEEQDKELLHRQVDEMSEGKFSSTTDILSRFSGKIEGFEYDKKKSVMDVNMAYSPEGQTVDMLFGDKVAGRQFSKFVKDMGGKPIDGKKGTVEFESHGKPAFRMNIQGADEDPIDAATTSQMKEFGSNTARMELMTARRDILPPPAEVMKDSAKALKKLKASKDKFTDEEWKEIVKLFKDNKGNPMAIVEALAKWHLLEFERKYLLGKTASRKKAEEMIMRFGHISNRLVLGQVMIAAVQGNPAFVLFSALSDEDKAKVKEKVKEKTKAKGKDKKKAPAEEVPAAEVPAEEVPAEDAAAAEVPAEGGDDLTAIVDGIAQEIEQIKSDGQVTPGEVMGLMDNMMNMVNELLGAKPARKPKAAALRVASIAESMTKEMTAGHSYSVRQLTLEVEGWQPVNVDVLRAIGQVWFDAEDDEGEELMGNMTSLRYERQSPRKYLTYGEEQAMKKRGEFPIQTISGRIPEGSHRAAAKALTIMLKRKFGLKVIKTKVSR